MAASSFFSTIIPAEFFRLFGAVGANKCCEPVDVVSNGLVMMERLDPRGV